MSPASARARGAPRALALAALALAALTAPCAPAAAEAVPLIVGADPESGRRVYKKCKACHTIRRGGPSRLGPNLWDVVGRAKAAVEDFKYSDALAGMGGVWSYEELDEYLRSPRSFVKGGRMAFAGLRKARDRAAVIAYLRTLSDDPVPLPGAGGTAVAAPAGADEADYDGLPPGDGREDVHALCGACHSLRLVTQQGLSERRWDELMDWMTEEQGMDELEPDLRRRIVRYLAAHYGEDRR